MRYDAFPQMLGGARDTSFVVFRVGRSLPIGNRCRRSAPAFRRLEFTADLSIGSSMSRGLKRPSTFSMLARRRLARHRNMIWNWPDRDFASCFGSIAQNRAEA